MPIEVITGPPFSGKAEFARAEIDRREQAGELGLALVDYTRIYSALFPGDQSSYRDEPVSDTGAPRMAGGAYSWALANLGERELSGYITTQSPRQAIAFSDRLGGAPIWDVLAGPDDIAERVVVHMEAMGRRVPRLLKNPAAGDSRCRRAVLTYFQERAGLVGRARAVSQRGRGRFDKGGTVRQFDQAAFNRGLTPAGREAREKILEETGAEPTPADVFKRVLQNLGRRP